MHQFTGSPGTGSLPGAPVNLHGAPVHRFTGSPGTGEEFQCADSPDEHDEDYITSLHSLVGSPVVKMVSFVL